MKKNNILIIDDEPSIVAGFRRELENAGYYVETALSGKEGIERFTAGVKAFGLVLVDLVLGDMNGVNVCKQIIKHTPDALVVLISGYPQEIEKYQMEFIKAGGVDRILRKPLMEDELTKLAQYIFSNKNI